MGVLDSLINGAFSLGGSALSAQLSYENNLALQQQSQEWQERMSNTAHQREVADLRAAGLNPILSANQGANAYSSGLNSAQVPDFGSTIATARELAQKAEKNKADVALETNQAKLAEEQSATEQMQQRNILANAIRQEIENGYLPKYQEEGLKKLSSEINQIDMNTALMKSMQDNYEAQTAFIPYNANTARIGAEAQARTARSEEEGNPFKLGRDAIIRHLKSFEKDHPILSKTPHFKSIRQTFY